MNFNLRKELARFLIITFIFFIIPSDTFSVKSDEKSGLKLIKEGEKLFRGYKYSVSVDKFHEAEKYVKNEKNLSRLYLGISRSYYAMGLMTRVREAINKLAILTVKSSIRKSEYPRGYLKIYNEILVEIEKRKREEQIVKTEEVPESINQVEKTGEETRVIMNKNDLPKVKEEIVAKKKSNAGVIEKPGVKKRKKKSLILPIVIGAVALGAAAMLMGKKSDGGSSTTSATAFVHIESVPSGAKIFVDGENKGVTTPADISVSEGSREIRVLIEGWGETTNRRDFAKDNSYTLNAELAPYKYQAVLDFSINPSVNSDDWDVDHSGNTYGIYHDGNYKMVKYNVNGGELFNRNLQSSGVVSEYFNVFFNNNSNIIYLVRRSPAGIFSFDTEGNLVGTSIPKDQLYALSVSNDNEIYGRTWGNITKFNSNFEPLEEFLTFNNYRFGGIKCAGDGQHIYIINLIEHKVKKYSTAGNVVLDWPGHSSHSILDLYITSFGSGELQKVFVISELNSEYEVQIFSENGEFLTTVDNVFATKIAEDDSYNFYIKNNAGQMFKYEPSSETEGSGTWEISSAVSNSFSHGLKGRTSIDPFQKKRTKKREVRKEGKNTRSKKI